MARRWVGVEHPMQPSPVLQSSETPTKESVKGASHELAFLRLIGFEVPGQGCAEVVGLIFEPVQPLNLVGTDELVKGVLGQLSEMFGVLSPEWGFSSGFGESL